MRVVNQITFEAKDDAEALRLAAERLGKDAVILSTRMVKERGLKGIFKRPVLRVTAGVIEEAKKEPKPKPKDPRGEEDTRRETVMAFQKFMELKERSSGGAASSPAVPMGGEGYRPAGATDMGSPDGDRLHISPEGLRSASGLAGPAKPQPAGGQGPMSAGGQSPAAPAGPVPDSGGTTISAEDARLLMNEVGALNQRVNSLIERLVAVENGGGAPRPTPTGEPAFRSGLPGAATLSTAVDRGLEERLRSSDVEEKYVRKLLADYGVLDDKRPFTEWLASRIVCAGDGGGDATGGRKVMLLGPTGVGKTTTIAKLATIQALLEHRNVLLLTSDTYRIAAVAQLETYAKILGVPMEVVRGAELLPPLLDEHENADIILLDTAGKAQKDKKKLEVFEALYNAFRPDAVHLVLAANMKYRDMLDVVEHIPNIPISHLIFTKLDETVSYGAIFNIQQMMGCPVSFLTAGQKVPQDIEIASGSRIAEFLMMTEEERQRA